MEKPLEIPELRGLYYIFNVECTSHDNFNKYNVIALNLHGAIEQAIKFIDFDGKEDTLNCTLKVIKINRLNN